MSRFAALLHVVRSNDTDCDKTNVLYTRDWALFMIDFLCAFRIWDQLQRPNDLSSVDRQHGLPLLVGVQVTVCREAS